MSDEGKIRSSMARGLLAAVGVGAALLVAGCGGVSGEPMVSPAPPPGWEQELSRARAERDAQFRSDPETPLLPDDVAAFRGLEYWPPDPAWRFVGPIHKYERPARFTILSTTGKERPCENYGWIRFSVGSTECTLQVYRLLDIGEVRGVESLFLPFTDATTGKETYPAGRYVDLTEPEPGRYVLDFNRAYNPLCAYGNPSRYRCPVTPAENRLPLRVEAGERGYKRRSALAS